MVAETGVPVSVIYTSDITITPGTRVTFIYDAPRCSDPRCGDRRHGTQKQVYTGVITKKNEVYDAWYLNGDILKFEAESYHSAVMLPFKFVAGWWEPIEGVTRVDVTLPAPAERAPAERAPSPSVTEQDERDDPITLEDDPITLEDDPIALDDDLDTFVKTILTTVSDTVSTTVTHFSQLTSALSCL